MSGVGKRLDRLESVVEQQQDTIEAQRERIAELEGDEQLEGDEPDDGSTDRTNDRQGVMLNRRSALKAGGLLALLFGSVGTAGADAQGRVGTGSDPLAAVHTEELNGGVTDDTALTDLLGTGLGLSNGSLGIDTDGVGAEELNTNFADLTTLFGSPVTTGGDIQSPTGSALTFNTDGGDRVLELGVPADDGFAKIAGGNVVAGHANNAVDNDAVGVVIGGGGADSGAENRAGENYATVGGGQKNEASGASAIVAGGSNNTAAGRMTTVSGGVDNTASGNYSMVAGGQDNVASGAHSFAAGYLAKTETKDGTVHDGTFVWGDSTGADVRPESDDQVVFQADGGMTVYTDSNISNDTGAELPSGSGTWASLSTKTAKSDVEAVSPPDVLDRVDSLDVATWRYDAEDDVQHMGPMAEDFYDAFGLGHDERRISNVDADGVALAAIQGLSQRLDHASDKLDAKDDRIATLEAENDRLRDRVAAIEDALDVDAGSDRKVAADE